MRHLVLQRPLYMSNTAMPQANQVASGFIGAHAIIDTDPGCILSQFPLVVDQHNRKVKRVQLCQVLCRWAREHSKEASYKTSAYDAVDDITAIFLMIYIGNTIQDEFIRGTTYDFAYATHQLRDKRPGERRYQSTKEPTALTSQARRSNIGHKALLFHNAQNAFASFRIHILFLIEHA